MEISTTKVKPAISWAGGKTRLLEHIFPLPDHSCYCEVFGGGLAVFGAKDRSQVEVINDINSELINFYRCVRFHRVELLRQFNHLPNSRQEFIHFKGAPGTTDIQAAASWFYRNALSFAGGGTSWGVTRKSGGGATTRFRMKRETIAKLSERLDGVNIENLDWHRCVDLYDSRDTLFFFDPPYVGTDQTSYESFTLKQMQELADRVRTIQGKCIVTTGDTPEMREMFSFAKFTSIERARGIANKNPTSTRYRELIIRPEWN